MKKILFALLLCSSNLMAIPLCQSGEFAKKPVGSCDVMGGVCTAKPAACTMHYAPVCGCDQRTYSNACAAATAGVNISYEEACVEK